jgi:hypothetical protein
MLHEKLQKDLSSIEKEISDFYNKFVKKTPNVNIPSFTSNFWDGEEYLQDEVFAIRDGELINHCGHYNISDFCIQDQLYIVKLLEDLKQ